MLYFLIAIMQGKLMSDISYDDESVMMLPETDEEDSLDDDDDETEYI